MQLEQVIVVVQRLLEAGELGKEPLSEEVLRYLAMPQLLKAILEDGPDFKGRQEIDF